MQTLSEHITERGAKFLTSEAILKKLPQDVQTAMTEGTKEIVMADFYIRKKIAGFSGIVDLIKMTDQKDVGVTNLDKAYIPKGTFFALCAVGMAYAYDAQSGNAAINTPGAFRYSNSEYFTTIPTKLINSEFHLLNGNKVLFRGVRTKKFFANAYAEYGIEANDENIVILPQPKLIDHEKQVVAQLEFASSDTLTAPSNSHYIEIRLVGVYIIDRAS